MRSSQTLKCMYYSTKIVQIINLFIIVLFLVISTTNGLPVQPTIQSSGHHRTSSAPPAPIPPPPPSGVSNPLPPQPPPMPGSLPKSNNNGVFESDSVVDQTSSLAVQLQAARLKRTSKVCLIL